MEPRYWIEPAIGKAPICIRENHPEYGNELVCRVYEDAAEKAELICRLLNEYAEKGE